MDTQKLKNNSQYYDDSYFTTTEVKLSLKEKSEYNIRLDEKYFGDILMFAPSSGEDWSGFTRDFHEHRGAWGDDNGKSEISDIQEYLSDLMYYQDKLTKYEETPEVFDLLVSFFEYAKASKCKVVMEIF